MGKAVKMSDIAEKLGVSTVTVSKALGDKDGVSEEIREKIKLAADEMGYIYRAAAKTRKDGRTFNVGVIISEKFIEVGVSFYWELYKILAEELKKSNYYPLFEILKLDDEMKSEVPQMVVDNKVDGIIVMGQVEKGYFNMIKAVPVPVVFLDFYETDISQDFVVTDNFYSMYLLTNHLVEMGHRDIGFVGNMKSTSSIQDRYLGYLKALIEGGIELQRCSRWYITDRDDKGEFYGFELMEPLPTAFVCNCDGTAYDLIMKLRQKGYRVPEDVSVVGFDNYSGQARTDVALTTVEVDKNTMAQTAVDILVKRINNVNLERGRRQIGGKILLKDSVRCIE